MNPRGKRYGLLGIILATTMLLCGCYAQEYVYVELVSDNVNITERGDPPHSQDRWFGEEVPISYELLDDNVEMTFSIGKESFVPDLVVKSSIPIEEILVKNCAYVIPRSENESVILWGYTEHDVSCVEMGETLRVEVLLDDFPRLIAVDAVVSASGTIIYTDSL